MAVRDITSPTAPYIPKRSLTPWNKWPEGGSCRRRHKHTNSGTNHLFLFISAQRIFFFFGTKGTLRHKGSFSVLLLSSSSALHVFSCTPALYAGVCVCESVCVRALPLLLHCS